MSRKTRRDILGGITVTLVLLLIGEFYFQWQDGKDTRFLYELSEWKVHDDELGYSLRPNFEYEAIHINSLGFRGREISVEKPIGVRRIAVLGESTSFGLLDTPSYSEMLDAHYQPCGIEVINAAVEGYNAEQVYKHFQRDVVPLDPDFIIVYEGWNDIYEFDPKNPKAGTSEATLLSKLASNSHLIKHSLRFLYFDLMPRLNAESTPAAYEAYYPQHLATYLTNIVELAQHEGIPVALVTLPSAIGRNNDVLHFPIHTPNRIDLLEILWNSHDAVIRQVAAERGVPLFDLRQAFADEPTAGTWFFDTLHFEEPGISFTADFMDMSMQAAGWLHCQVTSSARILG